MQNRVKISGLLFAAVLGVCGMTVCGIVPGNYSGSILENTERSAETGEEDSAAGDSGADSVSDSDTDTEIPEEYVIEGFPEIFQMPELPTGCEITALTMTLNYYGYHVDKEVMASDYLPVEEDVTYYGDDGLLYGNDLNEFFIGDPFTEDGIVCGTGAIVKAADAYLSDAGSHMKAVDLTGAKASELYKLVSEDIPVVVWVTINMENRNETQGWYTESGEYVEWSSNDHGAVLIGYSEDTVTIADPIAGITKYDRLQFERVYASRGNHAVILK